MSGLTSTGLVTKSLAEILSEIETEQRAEIDPALDLSAESVLGNLNAILATKTRELWELLLLVAAARDPRRATFDALDGVAALTGTARRAATQGAVTLTVTLGAGITLPAGSIAHVAGQPDNRWETTVSVTNSGGTAATFEVPARAVTAGRIEANATTITVIATPVSGWTTVTNLLDAAAGREEETDAELRLRREQELSGAASSPVPAIVADLLGVAEVVAVQVTENATASTDADGRPPHSVEAVVQFTPGLSGTPLTAARQAVAEQLWRSKAGGIATHGSQSTTVLDAATAARTVRWNEPIAVPIHVSVTISVDRAQYAGDDAVEQAILDFGAALRLGDDVIRTRLLCAVLDLPGVLDVSTVLIGTEASILREANILIDARQLASFDSSRIAVVAA